MHSARQSFKQLLDRYDLPHSHVYLVNLLPLIDMVWADGMSQRGETIIIDQYVKDHREKLRRMADGLEVISEHDYLHFKRLFLEQRPHPALMAELHAICQEMAIEGPVLDSVEWERLVDFCLDIAAACVAEYPYAFDERISHHEKDLLKLLLRNVER